MMAIVDSLQVVTIWRLIVLGEVHVPSCRFML